MTNLRCPIWAPRFVLKPKIRTNLLNESLCMRIMKMLGAWVILQKRVAPLNTFIIPPILWIWCLIIPILGTNKAQWFKLLRTKPSFNNSFTWGITSSSRGMAVVTSVLLQRRRCGGCLRREVYLMLVFIAKWLSFLANLLDETLTSLHYSLTIKGCSSFLFLFFFSSHLSFFCTWSLATCCCHLPYDGSAGKKPKKRLPKRKTRGSCHQYLFEENIRKPKKRSANIEKEGFESCLRMGKVLAPHAPLIRDDSL